MSKVLLSPIATKQDLDLDADDPLGRQFSRSGNYSRGELCEIELDG